MLRHFHTLMFELRFQTRRLGPGPHSECHPLWNKNWIWAFMFVETKANQDFSFKRGTQALTVVLQCLIHAVHISQATEVHFCEMTVSTGILQEAEVPC